MREIARKAGVSYGTYWRAELGRGCGIDTLYALHRKLDLSWDDMLEPVTCEHEWEPCVDDLSRCRKCKCIGREVNWNEPDNQERS